MKTYFMQFVLLHHTTSALITESEWTEWADVNECSAECSVGQVHQGSG